MNMLKRLSEELLNAVMNGEGGSAAKVTELSNMQKRFPGAIQGAGCGRSLKTRIPDRSLCNTNKAR